MIHDNSCKVHGAFSTLFGHKTNNEVEMRAIREGIALCKELIFSRIIIECDSLLVANLAKDSNMYGTVSL